MTLNPHLTDQLATGLRNLHHDSGCIVPDVVPSLIARLLRQLPGVDEKLLGEIVLHTADVAAAMATTMAHRGYRAEAIAPNVALAIGEAGARLYRGDVAGN